MHRDHSLKTFEEVVFLKLVGGGSLVIAYPSLLAIKHRHPQIRFKLVTTPAIRPFSDLMGIFDEIVIIREENPIRLVFDSISALTKVWRSSVMVDLEIHSRFSSVFSLLTCSLNRVGIYTDVSFWRRSLYTHLIFYNKISPIFEVYDQIALLLRAPDISYARAKESFQANVSRWSDVSSEKGKLYLGIAPACSDYGKERMLTAEHWSFILGARLQKEHSCVVHLLGGPVDYAFAEAILRKLKEVSPDSEYENWCGKLSLPQSVSLLRSLDALYCIDSSLIHFARLLDVPTFSFWGPTDPKSRLRPDDQNRDEWNYAALSCSPCIHIALEAPCYGKNICMRAAVEGDRYTGERNPIWLAKD